LTGGLIIFDLDGVLVDVGESYRETIIRTVEHFTGRRVTRDLIQQIKNRGGFNDDWTLSHTMIRDFGVEVVYPDVVDYFQRLFLGENLDGLGDAMIQREKWVPRNGLLERLAEQRRFAIFTGRIKKEARLTLDRCAPHLVFEPIVGSQDIAKLKPAPDGLWKIREAHADTEVVYIGDNVDDARSARAAGVPFIGVASADNGRREETARLFREEGAMAVIRDINELEGIL
jgi:HAD superfamily hydrolase (TIGR01548 family)